MTRGRVAAALMLPGAACLLVGLLVNSFLDSLRLLILGGFLLVAGVVLHVSRSPEQVKQEEQEESRSDAQSEARWDERLKKMDRSLDELSHKFRTAFASNFPGSELHWRIFSGAFVGFVLMVALPAIFVGDVVAGQPLWFLVCIGGMAYSFRTKPYPQVLGRLYAVLLIVAVPALVIAAANMLSLRAELATEWQSWQDGYAEFVRRVIRAERTVGVLLTGVLVGGVAMYRLRHGRGLATS